MWTGVWLSNIPLTEMKGANGDSVILVKTPQSLAVSTFKVARLAGFEPATYGLEVRCSIQLSYKRI